MSFPQVTLAGSSLKPTACEQQWGKQQTTPSQRNDDRLGSCEAQRFVFEGQRRRQSAECAGSLCIEVGMGAAPVAGSIMGWVYRTRLWFQMNRLCNLPRRTFRVSHPIRAWKNWWNWDWCTWSGIGDRWTGGPWHKNWRYLGIDGTAWLDETLSRNHSRWKYCTVDMFMQWIDIMTWRIIKHRQVMVSTQQHDGNNHHLAIQGNCDNGQSLYRLCRNSLAQTFKIIDRQQQIVRQ